MSTIEDRFLALKPEVPEIVDCLLNLNDAFGKDGVSAIDILEGLRLAVDGNSGLEMLIIRLLVVKQAVAMLSAERNTE